MDPKLAEIYGTNQQNEADLEKLAAAELAEGLANDEELDTDGLSEEELEAIAQDVLNASGEEGEDEGGDIDGQEKTSAAEEAQEKLAEADYLGRVMAHAYVNELNGIEKEAAKKEGPMTRDQHFNAEGSKQMGFKQKAHSAARQAGLALKKGGKRYGELMAGGAKGELGEMAGKRAGNAAILKNLFGKGGMRGEALKSMGARAGTAGAVGLAGLGAYKALKGKKKQSSAMDTLVEARIQEILEQSGIDPNELTQVEGQEKVSDPREALAGAVEERAWALLGQYGVVPNDEQGEE